MALLVIKNIFFNIDVKKNTANYKTQSLTFLFSCTHPPYSFCSLSGGTFDGPIRTLEVDVFLETMLDMP